MPISRRQFVRAGATAAVAGAVTPLLNAPAEATVMPRMKLETFSATAANVTKLKNGIAAMKALPAHDHRSWFWQAAIHAVLPAWVSALPPGTAPPAAQQTRFWNQCPHNPAHGSAEFLIWHRAYLYYFERTLRVMAHDPNLSLPYWNYEDASQRMLPAIYRTPQAGNPLYIPERTAALNNGTGSLSAGAVDASAAMGNPTFFGTTSANFGGFIAIGTEPGNKGLIEQRPHDTVHGAIGSPGWMGSVPTAAFDPIFWPHHTEIDHLFTLWACRGTRTWGPPSSYDAWWDRPVGWFMDANGTAVNPPRRMFATNAALGVRYDVETPGCVPLAPPASAHLALGLADTLQRSTRLGASGGLTLSTDQPASTTVPVNAQTLRSRAERKGVTGAAASRLVLGVAGVQYRTTPSVAYHVEVSWGGASPAPHTARVGVLTFFDHGGMAHNMAAAQGPLAEQLFDITGFARQQGVSADSLQVTFVPFDLVVDASGNAVGPRVADVRIGGIDVRDVPVPR